MSMGYVSFLSRKITISVPPPYPIRTSFGIASLPFRPYGPKVERRKCGHDRSGILTNCARGGKIICVFAFINQVALGFSASRLLIMQINGEYQRLEPV